MSIIDDIRRQLDRMHEGSRKRTRVYGRLSRVEPDGTLTTLVASNPDKVHVRTDEQQAATQAYHRNAVNLNLEGLPIVMYREDGELYIDGYNTGQTRAFLGGNAYDPFASKSVSGVADTPVILLPAGTVTGKLYPTWVCTPSSGQTRTGNATSAIASTALAPGGDEIDLYDSSTNVVKLRVNADGSVSCQRTAGSLIYTIAFTFLWT